MTSARPAPVPKVDARDIDRAGVVTPWTMAITGRTVPRYRHGPPLGSAPGWPPLLARSACWRPLLPALRSASLASLST